MLNSLPLHKSNDNATSKLLANADRPCYATNMGRPATAPNRRQVGLDDELWERVTNYRFANFLESESAALRELVVMGLEVAERKPAPTKKPATARGSGRKSRG